MKKIRELLFTELCQFLSLKNEEVNKKWRKMKDEEVMKEVNKKVSFSNLLGPPRLRFMQMIKPSKKITHECTKNFFLYIQSSLKNV